MANEAAREGWRLHHPNFVRFQQDARELLPAKSNETSRGLCPGFFFGKSGFGSYDLFGSGFTLFFNALTQY